MKNILETVIRPRETAKPATIEQPRPRECVGWQMILNIVYANRKDFDPKLKQMKELGKPFVATMSQVSEFGQDKEKPQYLAKMRAVLDGKLDAADMPTREEIKRQNAIKRHVIKAKASEISRKGSLIAVEILEQVKKLIPAYTADLLAKEKEITGNLALSDSPLKLKLADLPGFVETHIEKFRSNENPIHNPANIFEV